MGVCDKYMHDMFVTICIQCERLCGNLCCVCISNISMLINTSQGSHHCACYASDLTQHIGVAVYTVQAIANTV